MNKLPVLLMLIILARAQRRDVKQAKKGELFIYQLHSGNFFSRAEEVVWSASMVGRPTLPSWMHLSLSPYRAIAFLYGTPDTDATQYEIEVLARSMEGYYVSRKEFMIEVEQNSNYNGSIEQTAEFILENKDAWELLSDQRLAYELESDVKRTFPRIFPYIRNLKPADGIVRPRDTRGRREPKIGSKRQTFYTPQTIVEVATKKGFHPGVLNLAKGIHNNKKHCTRNGIIPLDKHFSPTFSINWCSFKVFNSDGSDASESTEPKAFPVLSASKGLQSPGNYSEPNLGAYPLQKTEELTAYQAYTQSEEGREYFWVWILVLPVPAVILICLILTLSFIFFGQREGQRWRDYKTPKEQLQQYLSLRKGQQRLRELNNQRQSLICVEQKPTGIQAFLTPKNGSLAPPPSALLRQSTPGSVMTTHDLGPVGKQTVAQAAATHGVDVAMYMEEDEEQDEATPRREDSSETDTITTPEELAQRKAKEHNLDISTSV